MQFSILYIYDLDGDNRDDTGSHGSNDSTIDNNSYLGTPASS